MRLIDDGTGEVLILKNQQTDQASSCKSDLLSQLADKLEYMSNKCSPYDDDEFSRGVIYGEIAGMIRDILTDTNK